MNKNLKIGLISDIHEDIKALERYLKYIQNSDIDIGVYLGDSVSRNCDDDTNYFWKLASKADKPIYYTVGNHDVGIDEYKSIGCEKIYDTYIYPMVDNKYLDINNTNNGKCYYYKDFDNYKIRLISIFEYEGTRDADLTLGFEHRRYISSEQLLWFAKTLYNTPLDYSVIVTMHQIPALKPNFKECNFCANVGETNLEEDLSDGYGYLQLSMLGNPLGDIINAFKNGLHIGNKYSVKEEYQKYLEPPTIDFDFSDRPKGKFICFLTGHLHCAFITTSMEYKDQLAITVPAASTGAFERQNDDIKPISENDDNFYILEINTKNKNISIDKIGTAITSSGVLRDRINLKYE